MAKIQELYSEVVIKYDESSISGLLNLLEQLENRTEELHKTLSGQLNKALGDTSKASEMLTKQTDQLATVMNKPIKNSGILTKQNTQLSIVMKKNTKDTNNFKTSLVSLNRPILKVMNDSKRMGTSIRNSFLDATKGANSLKKGMSGIQKMVAAGVAYVGIRSIKNFYSEAAELYEVQFANEVKLQAVLENTNGIREGAVDRLKDVASAIQEVGIVGDEVTLGGMQQLATFKLQEESIAALAPGMADLLAQQKNFNATSGDAVNVANMIGKVLEGQVGALSRVGISLDDNQKKVLKYGNEQQKVAVMAKILEQNVGGVNKKLRETPLGELNAQKNTWGDIKEEIGEGVIPLISEFYGLLLENKDVFKEIAVGALELGLVIAEEIVPKINEFIQNLDEDDVKEFFDSAAKGAKNLMTVIEPLAVIVSGISKMLELFFKFAEMTGDTFTFVTGIDYFTKSYAKTKEAGEIEEVAKGIGLSGEELKSKFGTSDLTKIGDIKKDELSAGANTIAGSQATTMPSIFNSSSSSNLDNRKKTEINITNNIETKSDDQIPREISKEIEMAVIGLL